MKKTKSFAALLVAISLLAPALIACAPTDSGALPPADSSVQTPETSTPDSSTGNSGNGGTDTPSSGTGNSGNGGNAGSNGDTGNTGNSSNAGNSGTSTPVSSAMQYIRCTGDNVNLRAGAGTGYAVLGSAEKNTRYAIIGKTGEWYKTYYRGKTAYIHASYAAVFEIKKSTHSQVEKVLDEGYKHIGVPYVYGAVRIHDGNGKLLSEFTAQKFDCSSLVQYVFYKAANVKLQVTTRTQVTQGKYVPKSDLRRGDCIYFTNEQRQYKTGIERVGHVAIYLGDDYILHTASDYARIEKMSTQRWKFYIEARRFV